MKRRDILKSCLVAPFVGLLKKKTRSGTKIIAELPKSLTAKDICNMALEEINEPKCLDDEFCQDPNCPYGNGAINPYLANSRQRFPLGTRLVTSGGIPHRYVKSSPNTKIFGKPLSRPIYFWISENQWIFDNSGDFIKS